MRVPCQVQGALDTPADHAGPNSSFLEPVGVPWEPLGNPGADRPLISQTALVLTHGCRLVCPRSPSPAPFCWWGSGKPSCGHVLGGWLGPVGKGVHPDHVNIGQVWIAHQGWKQGWGVEVVNPTTEVGQPAAGR